MSIHLTFRGDLIVVTAHGVSSYEEVTGTFDRIVSSPMFKPPARILFDGRYTDYGPPAEELRSFARHLDGIEAFTGSRWAILARPASLVFGLARLFCGHAQSAGFRAEPFSDFLEACAWLLRPGALLPG